MKRKPDDEGNTDQAKRINMNFSVPPPNIQLPVQMPQQAIQPLPMTMLPPSPQPDAGYYLNNMNMNNLNGPWRGRNNRSGQNFGYNIRGGQNVWTRSSRGSGPNQRNYRPGGGQGPYFRGGGQKGNNQFCQQSFFQNQGFSCPNNFNSGPYSNFLAQGSWQAEGFVAQEDGSNAGSKSRAQGRPLTPNSTGSDMELTDVSGGGNTKSKRRSMSQSYPSRPWDREAAEKALATELEFLKALRNQNLVIKFPDPDLNKEIVKAFHPNIVNVHFQVPSGPRFCFVQLEEGADADEVMEALGSCTFGSGKLQVEKRGTKEDDNLCPETIDPLTLYIGNLPSTITIQTMREKFSTSSRIDIGYAQRMKYTRYAFIRYATAEDALDAFRKTHNLQLENRSVIVRFRRHKAASPSQNSNKKLKTLDLEPESSFYADDSNVWLNSDTNDNLVQRVTTALPALEGWFNLDGLDGEAVCSKQKKKSATAAVSTSAAASPVSSATAVNSDVMSNSVKTRKEGDSDDEDEEEEEKLDDEEADEDEDDEDDSDDDSDEDEEDEEEDEEDEEEENTAPPPGATRDEDDDDSSDEDPQEYEDDDDDD